MPIQIERRAYGPASTKEEAAAIRARLRRIGKSSLVWQEMPVQSAFSVSLLMDEIHRLTESMDWFHLIVDLTHADPPPQEVRSALYKGLDHLPKLRKCACFTGRNFLLNAAVKFVLAAVKVPVTMHKTLEEALREVGDA
jgi:hypothetical protein